MTVTAPERPAPSRTRASRARPPRADQPAAVDPVASLVLDVGLAHLDRPFDYLVPERLAAAAVPGARVRVRFAGRAVDGFVTARSPASTHPGRLAPLVSVVSAEPVLDAGILELARRVARRCAGTTADVLRLAVPPRHAAVEAEPPRPAVEDPLLPPRPGPWSRLPEGPGLLAALRDGAAPRAVLPCLPGDGPGLLAAAAAATLAGGRGTVLVVPDARDLPAFDGALSTALGAGRHVVVTADLGPAERYRRWLAVRRGAVRVVLGTRAAAFAPVTDPGLLACWDDGDDLLAEPRAPYPHVRDVLVLRAATAGAGLLLAGHAVSTAAAALLRSGWARPVTPGRDVVRAGTPAVVVAGADAELARDPAARTARVPAVVLRTVRVGLATGGPVLVAVPRAGYRPTLGCGQCRAPARCGTCAGPLGQVGRDAVPGCRWCGRPAADWACPACGSRALRSRAVGSGRTAEELGRAFPGILVVVSGSPAVADVPARPALVVATPGAEPVAAGGYAAAVLLDGGVLLDRPELAAGEEALRRWLNAAALVRPAGPVVLVAPADQRPVQALVRWDPLGFADAELTDRVAVALPPAAVVAELVGPAPDVADLLARSPLPQVAEVLGPVPVPAEPARPGPGPGGGEESVRAVVRVPVGSGLTLTDALRIGQAQRSARKAGTHVRVRIDPVDLG